METQNITVTQMLENELSALCKDFSVILHTKDEYECWIMPNKSVYYTQLVRGNSYEHALINGITYMTQFNKTRKAN